MQYPIVYILFIRDNLGTIMDPFFHKVYDLKLENKVLDIHLCKFIAHKMMPLCSIRTANLRNRRL